MKSSFQPAPCWFLDLFYDHEDGDNMALYHRRQNSSAFSLVSTTLSQEVPAECTSFTNSKITDEAGTPTSGYL
jgi:hypothetical protein